LKFSLFLQSDVSHSFFIAIGASLEG
jgi:hypothetical protein